MNRRALLGLVAGLPLALKWGAVEEYVITRDLSFKNAIQWDPPPEGVLFVGRNWLST